MFANRLAHSISMDRVDDHWKYTLDTYSQFHINHDYPSFDLYYNKNPFIFLFRGKKEEEFFLLKMLQLEN